ncbi:MAG: Rieske (2Fe-2S) protein [Streptosporangiaceae bacterium]|jgi:Rieske Fe-S protein
MIQSQEAGSSRRTVLACAGAACAAALTGCATYNSNSGINTSQGTPSSSPPTASGTGAAAGSGGSGGGAAVLAKTSDVPVGGGTILTDKKIVITQPQSGTFHAFTAICTHAGCTVGSVSNGTINCPCHGSRFNINNGAVVNGPAAAPLAAINIKVQGTSILQA